MRLTNARPSSFCQRASSLGDLLVLVRLGAKTEVATHWERRCGLILGNWERGWSCKLVTSGKVHVVSLDRCENNVLLVGIVSRVIVDVSDRDAPIMQYFARSRFDLGLNLAHDFFWDSLLHATFIMLGC